jgi:MFS family permease
MTLTLTENSVSTGRKAGATQGWTLAGVNWLNTIAVTVLAPVLPKIYEYFKADPHVAVMVSLMATLPALFVALCAWPAGLLADRYGTRLVLLFGVGVYGFVGCAPMFMNSLLGIVITRAGVGIAEATIMTCTTALVADYFHVSERAKWLAVQTGGAGVVAVTMVTLGGVLGQGNWRFPFIMYSTAFLMFPLCLFKTWEPVLHTRASAWHSAGDNAHSHRAQPAAVKFNWLPLAVICLITLFASMAFFVVTTQLGFILTERGVTNSGTIGIGCSIAVLFMPLGSYLFTQLPLPVFGKLTASFTLSAVGFFVLALSHGFLFTEVGASINGLGSGMILPTLITWAMSKLPIEVRARGTGLWQSSMFLGQFLSPLAVLFLKNTSGSESNAVLIFAVACSIAAAMAVTMYIRTGSQPLVEAE